MLKETTQGLSRPTFSQTKGDLTEDQCQHAAVARRQVFRDRNVIRDTRALPKKFRKKKDFYNILAKSVSINRPLIRIPSIRLELACK